MTSDDVTPGEIGRALTDLRMDLRELSRQFTRADVYQAAHQALSDRVQALEERETWRSRLVAGALVTAAFSVIVSVLVFIITSR